MRNNKAIHQVISALVDVQYETPMQRRFDISFVSYGYDTLEMHEIGHNNIFDIDVVSKVLNKLPVTWYIGMTDDKPVVIIIVRRKMK